MASDDLFQLGSLLPWFQKTQLLNTPLSTFLSLFERLGSPSCDGRFGSDQLPILGDLLLGDLDDARRLNFYEFFGALSL